jgi:hypothetical protein
VLVTNHVLSGAVAGAVIRRPVPAFLVGVASHFVLDALPHWGRFRKEQFLRVAVADGLTGLAAMGALAAAAPAGRRAAVVAGMAGAALPDLDKPALLWFGASPFPAPVDRFHTWIQDEAPDRFGHEAAAAAGFAGAALLLFAWKRGRPGTGPRQAAASRSSAVRIRFSETGTRVPSVCANRLTRNSSISQRTARASSPSRAAAGRPVSAR